MRRTVATLAMSSVLASLCCLAAPARAGEASDTDSDEKKTADTEKGDAKEASEGDAEKKEADKPVAKSDVAADKGAEGKDNSPVEEKGKTYYFVGLRYRGIIIPQFMQNIFAEGGKTIYVNGIGPEFSIRKDNFEYNLSAWLAFYSMDDTAYKGKSDPEAAWELINADLTLLYLTSDFMWSHPFTPEWALNYGLGAGFGIVFGELRRSQSYPTAPGQNPNNYSKCIAPGNPMVIAPNGDQYCDNSNDHYNNHSEPSWANGGSKPVIFPWLAVQTGVRFKPTKNIVARLDLGFGTSGFFFGLGGDYGL